jgi:hypothetical protein
VGRLCSKSLAVVEALWGNAHRQLWRRATTRGHASAGAWLLQASGQHDVASIRASLWLLLQLLQLGAAVRYNGYCSCSQCCYC